MSNSGKNKNRKRLKIAIVLNRFYPEVGGAETNLHFQACELSKNHDVTVFTPRRRKDTPAKEQMNDFKVIRPKDWLNPFGVFPNMRRDTFMPQMFFHIFLRKFDVVQVFPALNKNNILAMLAAKLRRRPFILCSFDLLDYALIEKQTGKIDPNCLDDYTPSRIRRFLFRHCSHIFAISEREIAFFRRYNENVSFSPVPIEPSEYQVPVDFDVRKKYNISTDQMIFLVLGRISKIKGQDIAVDAFCKISAQIPNAVMVLVGRDDYEPELFNAIKTTIAENKLEQRIFCTGMVERTEVVGFLQQSDIHIVPVRFMNSGAVVVESWAGGIPVIQSDSVDPNLIKPEHNGYLFQSENIDELASVMIQAYTERKKLPEMGKAGRKMVLERFTYGHLIEIYHEIYLKLTARNKGKL